LVIWFHCCKYVDNNWKRFAYKYKLFSESPIIQKLEHSKNKDNK